MLDNGILALLEEAKRIGAGPLDIMSIEAMIIPWGPDCCHGCEFYECGHTITAHGYCPKKGRRVSPHYFCSEWEQD
jgi:hypothetical protein